MRKGHHSDGGVHTFQLTFVGELTTIVDDEAEVGQLDFACLPSIKFCIAQRFIGGGKNQHIDQIVMDNGQEFLVFHYQTIDPMERRADLVIKTPIELDLRTGDLGNLHVVARSGDLDHRRRKHL